MANRRPYRSKFGYSEEDNHTSFIQYEKRASSPNSRGNLYNQERDHSSYYERQNDRGNFENQGRDHSSTPIRTNDRESFYSRERDYSSNPKRKNDRENFSSQGRDHSSTPDRTDDRGSFYSQERDYSSNPERQNDRRNFGKQGRHHSSTPDRANDRGNFYGRERDYSSNPERSNDRRNFRNQGRDHSLTPDGTNDRGNFYSQERDYSSNPERQNIRGNFGTQGRDHFSTPDATNDRGNFYSQERDYPSNPGRQNDRGNFGNQGRDRSSTPDRTNGRDNFYSQERDYSLNPERQNDRGNFGNQGRDHSSTPDKINDRGNFYSRERDYSSYPERQNDSGYFGNQGRNHSLTPDETNDRGIFYGQERDYSSNPRRENDRGNFGNQGRDRSSTPDRTNDRGIFYSQERDYSSNPERQNDRGNFGNQGGDHSSTPDRINDRGNFYSQERDYSLNPERQNDGGNFGNQGKDHSSIPDRPNVRGNFYNQERDYLSNSERQNDRGNFGKQGIDYSSNYDKGYLINQDKSTPFNKNDHNNFYRGRDYFHDTQASTLNQITTSRPSIKLGNSCDEQLVFNDDKFSQHSQSRKRTSQISNHRRQDNKPWSIKRQFGQVKKDIFDGNKNKLSSGQDTLIQAQRSSIKEESNFKKGGSFVERDNVEEEDNDDEQTLIKTDQDWNDDECDGSDDEEPVKVDAFVPSQELVEKYKYFPPSAEEMGAMFKGLVIYYFYKVKNVQEKNPFVIICESFRRSDQFGSLEIEDGYKRGDKDVKYCTIRWNGIMMVRGVGYSGNLKEPRVLAGVELINNLAMTCYTLKMKDSYYGLPAIKQFIKMGTDESNTARVVKPDDAPTLEAAQQYINNFFKDDNDFELFFTVETYLPKLKWWAKNKGYEIRSPNNVNVIGVSLRRSPQYWRDKILVSGKMENERFELVPPQGFGKLLLNNFDVKHVIGRLRKPIYALLRHEEEKTKYAHNDAGLGISKALPPWDKSRVRRGPKKNTNKKLNQIEKAIQEGQPLTSVKAYKYLNRQQKKKIRQRLNINNN